jgi:iron(III) transport system permease protein
VSGTALRPLPLPARAGRLGAAARRAATPQVLVLAVVVLAIGWLALVPLGYLLWATFVQDGAPTLVNFREAYGNEAFALGTMLWNSLRFAVGATLLALVIGTTLAYLTVRTDVPMRGLIFAAALVPLIMPGVLNTISWIFLASPQIGWINRALEPLFGPATVDIFSLGGMIMVEGLSQSPLVFLLMYAAFRSMDPSLEESALMSGARLSTVVRRITLPLARPTLYAALLIMTVLALEAFETPALLGIPSGIWVFTSRIYRVLSEFPVKYGEAGAYSISLLALTSIGVFWQSRLSASAKAFQTVTGKGFRPRPMPLGRWRWPAAAFVGVYFLFSVALPMLVLLYTSTQPFYSVPSIDSLTSMTFDNYRATFESRRALGALANSLVLAVGTATAVMVAMAVAAWLVVRSKVPGRWLVDNLAFLPLTVPGLVMGVALLTVYLRIPVAIYGTLWILFISYCTRYMPYGMRYAATGMYAISAELEESAQTSGASWWQSFRRIVLPLLRPGLVAGWIYIVMVSIRELSSSVLLYSPGNEVLAIHIWELWEDGQVTELSAAAVVLMAMLVALVLVAQRLGARIGVQDS